MNNWKHLKYVGCAFCAVYECCKRSPMHSIEMNATIITWRYRSNLHWSQRLRKWIERERVRASLVAVALCFYSFMPKPRNIYHQMTYTGEQKPGARANDHEYSLELEIKARALAVCDGEWAHVSNYVSFVMYTRYAHDFFPSFCPHWVNTILSRHCEEEARTHRAMAHVLYASNGWYVRWSLCAFMRRYSYLKYSLYAGYFKITVVVFLYRYFSLRYLSLSLFFLFFHLLLWLFGSSGELVLIYLFLTFAIYIEQTAAHSKKAAVSCIEQ